MGIVEVLLIGVGLSMDAFAAAVCKGLAMPSLSLARMLVIGLFFGGFQALMPCLGYFLGRQFEAYITAFDHWIAFGLLCFIGGKMIYDVVRGGGEDETYDQRLDVKELFTLSIATSIDALAVGISFAFLQVALLRSVLIIGLTTFCLSAAGVWIGHRFGVKYKEKATLAGGVILILIGGKILLEHLGLL